MTHEVKVGRTFTMGAMSSRARFYSSCSCGWRGQTRMAVKAGQGALTAALLRAENDAAKHAKAEGK